MKIAYKNSTGEIVACGTHIDHMSSTDVSLVEGYCNPGQGYIKDSKIIYYSNIELEKYRNRPKFTSYWDNNSMSWIDDRSIEEIKLQKYIEIKNMAAFTDISDINVNGYIYQADKVSRDIMSQKLLVAILLNKESNFVIEWYLKDGSTIDLSFYQLKDVLSAIDDRSDRIFKMKKRLKELIFNSNKDVISIIRWPDFI